MSGYSVILYVGAPTLAAAIITLCGLQITSARMDRNSRRSRMLEGPIPGRQSLSSIGLNNQSKRSAAPSSGHHGQRATTPERTPKDAYQKAGSATSNISPPPALTREAKLNFLQTIQARSAALQSNGHPDKPADPKPLMPAYAPSTQRPGTRALSVQEQGSAAPRATSGSKQQENVDRTPSNAGLDGDSTGSAIVQKTPTSKRAKRANTQSEQNETAHHAADQAPADALADLKSLGLLDTLQSSPAGDSPLPQPTPEGGVLDIFAGLSEAEAGLHDFMDDLNDIDGGGLPTVAPKTPQKSRR